MAAAAAHGGADLAVFAGVMYDHSVEHPEHLRIIDWARLERQDTIDPPIELVDVFHAEQVKAIRSLQESGSIDDAWDPDHLSALVFGIVTCWLHEPASALSDQPAVDPAMISARRASVVRAVQRLIEPGD